MLKDTIKLHLLTLAVDLLDDLGAAVDKTARAVEERARALLTDQERRILRERAEYEEKLCGGKDARAAARKWN